MKQFIVTVNGNRYEVQVEEVVGGVAPVSVASPTPVPTPVVAAPVVAPVAPAPANKPAAPTASGAEGSVKIACPMPGKIVGVKATVGQQVSRGDVIAILEAMKMENEVVATEDGTVASINVTQGQAVESGDLIATLN